MAASIDELIKKYGEVENATLVDTPPPGDYVYELKYDGYRIVAFKSGTQVQLVSRRGQDWTSNFREIADGIAKLPVREVVLDGEVVALDERDTTSFQRLQNRQGLAYIIFDLLCLEGEDYRSNKLSERRAALERTLGKPEPPLALSPTVRGDVIQLLKASCDGGFEGLIGKRAGSAYIQGRTLDWIKLKCQHRQEFAIIGYLPFTGTQRGVVGSLLLAVWQGGQFVFCGKTACAKFHNRNRPVCVGRLTRRLACPSKRKRMAPQSSVAFALAMQSACSHRCQSANSSSPAITRPSASGCYLMSKAVRSRSCAGPNRRAKKAASIFDMPRVGAPRHCDV